MRGKRKIPMAPVEKREVHIVPVKTIPRPPAKSELPPAHVCTREGDALRFVRELSQGKRLYSCPTCGGTFVFTDKI